MSVEKQRLSLVRLMEQLPQRAQQLHDDSKALLVQAGKLVARVELLDAQANRLAYGLLGQATALDADMGTLNAIAHSIGDLVDWPPAGWPLGVGAARHIVIEYWRVWVRDHVFGDGIAGVWPGRDAVDGE